MPAPTIMTAAEWKQRTKVNRVLSDKDKKRSDALVALDNMVTAYEQNKTVSNLTFLKRFLEAWMSSKKTITGNDRSSMRDYDGAVTELKAQVDRATTLWHPTPTAFPGILIGNDTYRGNDWVPDGFVGAVATALQSINSKPIGKKLLSDLSQACRQDPIKKIVIEYGARSTAAPIAVVTNESRKKVQPIMGDDDKYDLDELMSDPALLARPMAFDQVTGERNFVGGAGTGAVVTFNHTDPGPPGAARPVFIALAHELIHALHYVTGTCYRAASGGIRDGGNTGLMEEEMRTVGLHQYARELPSENAIRGEHGIPLRTNYTAGDSFANVTASRFV